MKQQQDKYDILKTYYGYDTFRDGQEELIDCLLNGQDVCGIMPTGAGKSVCYQVPALLLPHVTLVVSPLISLMKDQVRALNQMGVHAAYLNSSLSWNQYKKALAYAKEGRYKIIYVAPERLLTEDFLDFAASTPISLLAVDEAHCVSQWGQDFRPSYLKIPEFVRTLPIRPVIGAFTATATREVREDIIRMLELSDPHVAVTGFDRKNLYFEVRHDKDKYRSIRDYLLAHPDSSGIIYCATRKNVEEVCDRLLADGFRATRYHAGLSDEERRANQEAFTYDDAPIMVATNAFGMGIDKSNVRFVLHYNMPKNMESYYQEAGRAGRDGAKADCILFYSGQDVITNQFFIEQDRDNEELTGEALEEVRRQDRERLKKMTFYCHTTDCLRDYMLRYFGEFGSNYCGNCSNCLNTFETIDITELANDLIGCILTSGMRFGVNVILDTLRGSKNEKVLRFGLDSNRYYATHAHWSGFQPLLRNARPGYHRFSSFVAQLSRSDGLSGRYRRSVSYCKSERKGTVFLCRVRGIPPRTHDEGSKEDYADTCKSRAASRHGQIRQKAFFPAHRQRSLRGAAQAAYRNRTGTAYSALSCLFRQVTGIHVCPSASDEN